MKKCRVCQIEKELNCFNKAKSNKDGFGTECRECAKIRHREWYLENKERMREYGKWRRIHKRDAIRKCNVAYYERKNYLRRLRYKNDETYRKRVLSQIQDPKHTEKRRATRRKWMRENLQRPEFRLVHNLRRRLRGAMNKNQKSARSLELIGCNGEELMKYLELKFTAGMSWDNYGFGADKWVVDHIIPCKDFDLTIPENQRKCFHYSNLQPLWYLENCAKDNYKPLKEVRPPSELARETIDNKNQATYSSNPPLSLV